MLGRRAWILVALMGFILRVLVWGFGVYDVLGLKQYDMPAYAELGRKLLWTLSTDWSLLPTINPVQPPLGKLLLGTWNTIFAKYLGEVGAAGLLMSIFSLATALLLYRMAENLYGERASLIALTAFSFSPYAIHWTAAWLDTPTLLFITLAQYLAIKKKAAAAGIFYGLALLTKYHSIFLLPLAIIFIDRKRDKALFIAVAFITGLMNPYLWVADGLKTVVSANLSISLQTFEGLNGSFLTAASVILMEVPYRLGLGYVGQNASPYILPLLVLLKRDRVNRVLSKWLIYSLLPAAAAPRLLVYETYYLYTLPPLALMIAVKPSSKPEGVIQSAAMFFLTLSPIALTTSLLKPEAWKIAVLASSAQPFTVIIISIIIIAYGIMASKRINRQLEK